MYRLLLLYFKLHLSAQPPLPLPYCLPVILRPDQPGRPSDLGLHDEPARGEPHRGGLYPGRALSRELLAGPEEPVQNAPRVSVPDKLNHSS